jgi:hypothetical protein
MRLQLRDTSLSVNKAVSSGGSRGPSLWSYLYCYFTENVDGVQSRCVDRGQSADALAHSVSIDGKADIEADARIRSSSRSEAHCPAATR